MSAQLHNTHVTVARKDVLPYPIDDPLSELDAWFQPSARGLSSAASQAGSHPILVALEALSCWNRYLAAGSEQECEVFLLWARWLVEHQQSQGEAAGGWLVPCDTEDQSRPHTCLSATAQGCALSVLTRACQVSSEASYRESAVLAREALQRDIFAGGLCAPLGADGVFFQERASYPAAHTLLGGLCALLGLAEHAMLLNDPRSEEVVRRGLDTLHRLFAEFDTGNWTRSDLLHRHFSLPAQLAFQAELLAALSRLSQCEQCSARATRWRGYQQSVLLRLRFSLTRRIEQARGTLRDRWQRGFFPQQADSRDMRVCIPVFGFPVTGGTRAVLSGVARVTGSIWQIEYLTQTVRPHTEDFIIHTFGTKRMAPWQFPAAWFYALAGFCKLTALLHNGAGYTVILPQDGVYSACYSALAGRLAGVRVVCIDHGNLTLLDSRAYREECLKALATENWSLPRRLFARARYIAYWPSLRFFAWVAARLVDAYLVPGIAGDGIEEDCQRIGIPHSHLQRFASMIDISRHVLPDGETRAKQRAEMGLAADSMVIAMICRLSPEKGIEVALEGIAQALGSLVPALRQRTQIVIAGTGPLQHFVEDEIARRGLGQNCHLCGEISSAEVITLLGASDLFLYTSTRGACFSMAVLEAMASACAVIATARPVSNHALLADGRGIAIAVDALPQNEARSIGDALVRLVGDPALCQRMGQLARQYIAENHSPALFSRVLLRATAWPLHVSSMESGNVREVAGERGR